ncbi:MAG: SpoIIE family protein phosphatase, partial [Clostridia bacterium]|nr:SpoIIE family protein phosphatase [Clostridia bacterium]
MENKGKRKSLSRRIGIELAALMIIMAFVVAVISYFAIESTYMRLYNEKARDIVSSLANQVDGDKVLKYVESGETDEYYDELQLKFNEYKEDFSGIQYLYLFHPESDRFIYLLEAIKEGDDLENINAFGDDFEYGPTEYKYLVPDIEAKRASTELILGEDAGYGRTLSAWAPVFDSAGNIVAMVEADCILQDLNAVARGHSFSIVGALVLCMICVLFLVLWILRRNVTQPIGKLTGLVDAYTHGELKEEKFRFDDEMQWLASSFSDMTRRIEQYIKEVAQVTAEKERIGAELSIATQIQADMLPRIFPAFPERGDFDIYATMNPAKEVGGDFYDFFLIDDDHLGLVMADVSGKGVPAALFMVIAKTLIKNRALLGESPSQILENVNNQLCDGNEAELFVTVWLAVIDLTTGKGLAANAGHEHPVIRRKDGKYELVVYRHSPAVATMEGVRFREHEFELRPGDRLFVYTDGVPEATNANNELFGNDRMLDALNENPEATPKELLETVRRRIDEFVGDAPQFDDITMLGFNYGTNELVVDAKVENLDNVLAFVDENLERLNCSPKTQMQIDVAVEEIFVNIAHYAYGEETGKATIKFEKTGDPLSAVITFSDSGTPYDP